MANDRDPRSDLGAWLGEDLRRARLDLDDSGVGRVWLLIVLVPGFGHCVLLPFGCSQAPRPGALGAASAPTVPGRAPFVSQGRIVLVRRVGAQPLPVGQEEAEARPPSEGVAPKIAEMFPSLCNGLYIRLAAIARKSNGPIPEWFADNWLGREREATWVRIWQPIIVPGLFCRRPITPAGQIRCSTGGPLARSSSRLVTACTISLLISVLVMS